MKRFVAALFVAVLAFGPVAAQGEIVSTIVGATEEMNIMEATQEKVDELQCESNSGGGVDPQEHIRWLWVCSTACVFACGDSVCLRSGATCYTIGTGTYCKCDTHLCS